MHGSVRKQLERVLAAKPSADLRASSHISECRQCASEVEAMRLHRNMLRTLKTPECEPGAGFYARVLQRIEQSARRSIWWVFVYSPIGKRLAYASLALSIAFGSYVVAAERNDGHFSSRPVVQRTVVASDHYDAIVMGSLDQQRAAVLANFVSHPSAQTSATTAQ